MNLCAARWLMPGALLGAGSVARRAARGLACAALFALVCSACLPRARLQQCRSDEDCDVDSYCVFLTSVSGVCQRLVRVDAGPSPDAGPQGQAAVVEVESFAVRINDTPAAAQQVALRPPFAISGTIGTFDGVRGDVDCYDLSARERTLLEVVAEPTAGSPARLRVSLVSPAAAEQPRARSAEGGAGGYASRQFFLPTGGTYTLCVEDARNRGGPPYFGGLNFGYLVKVSSGRLNTLTLSPQQERTQAVVSAGRNGALPAFRLELTRGVSFVAETVAQRGNPPVPLNTALYLVRRSQPQSLVGASDDIQPAPGLSDARVAEVLGAGNYELIVDVEDIDNGAPGSFETTVRLFAQSREQEPNDTPSFAFPIPSPSADVQGTIAAPTTGRADVDVYALRLQAGQLLRLQVQAQAELLPRLRVRAPDGSVFEQQPNLASTRDTTLELLSITGGVHTVEVEDARNAPASMVGAAGGDAFGYRLRAAPFERRPKVLGPVPASALVLPSEALANVGGKQWYRFELPDAGGLVHVVAAPVDGWLPSIALYGGDGLVFIGRGAGAVSRYLDSGEYWLSVSDPDGRAGLQYALRLSKQPAVPEEMLGPQPPGSARPPLIIKGQVKEPPDVDSFFVDLQVGTSVDFATLAGSPYGINADTVLTVSDSEGRVLAVDDDGGEDGLSRIGDFAVPATGRYTVRVSARLGRSGAYLLAVIAKPCPLVPGAVEPSAFPGALAFNEVLLSSLEDANGDGPVSATSDAFVELINTLPSAALDLGGLSLRDTTSQCDPSGEHRLFTFACGATLKPGHLAVIFGGGEPYGTFGGAAVVRAAYPDRCRLHVDPTGDTFTLVGRDGSLLSSFAFPDPALCGGPPCDCRGVSCARQPDGVGGFRLSRPARQTPGRRYDGSAPDDPFAPNDLCENARPVQPGELVAGSGTTATNNNRGQCGVDRSDLVYSFILTETRDVEITAPGAETIYVRSTCARDRTIPDVACAPRDSLRLTDLPGSAASPQRYYVFVEATGPFVLRLQTSPPAAIPGDRCRVAIPLALGSPLSGQTTVGASDDYRPSQTCGSLSDELRGRDLVYRVPLREGQRVRARVTPTWPFDPALFVTADCSLVVPPCLGATDLGVSGEPEVLTFTASETRDYFFIVDSYAEFEQGTFEILVEAQ